MVIALLNSPWKTEEIWPLGSKQIICRVVGVDGWSTGGYRDGALLASYSVITRYAASCSIIWCPPAHYHPWTNIRMALQLINKHFEQTLRPAMMTLQTFAHQWWHYCCHREHISDKYIEATRSLLLINWGKHTQANKHKDKHTSTHKYKQRHKPKQTHRQPALSCWSIEENIHRQTNTKTNTQAQTQTQKHQCLCILACFR